MVGKSLQRYSENRRRRKRLEDSAETLDAIAENFSIKRNHVDVAELSIMGMRPTDIATECGLTYRQVYNILKRQDVSDYVEIRLKSVQFQDHALSDAVAVALTLAFTPIPDTANGYDLDDMTPEQRLLFNGSEPMFDKDGARIGTKVRWQDRSKYFAQAIKAIAFIERMQQDQIKNVGSLNLQDNIEAIKAVIMSSLSGEQQDHAIALLEATTEKTE